MIIVFILLGLGFLGGGVAAIVDGLPYMMLERGFTQVIIGTVAAAAGVLMLALSWVLVELRRLKQTLSNAAMAMSVASMIGSPAAGHDAAAPHAAARPDDAAAGMRPGVPAAGIGALAGAGAALAAAQALGAPARQEPEPAGAPQEPADKPAERDLFGGEPAKQAGEFAGEHAGPRAGEAPAVPESMREADVDALPAFDPFRPVDPQGEPGSRLETAPFDTEAEPVGSAALMAEAAAMDESEGEPHESAAEASPVDDAAASAGPGSSDIDDPFAPGLIPATVGNSDPAREADEFGLLRESLTALRFDSEPASRRIEPSFSEIDRTGTSSGETGRSLDDLAVAGNWMEPALQRRAPWFGDTGETPREDTSREDVAQPETVPEPAWPGTTWPEPAWSQPALPEPETPLWPPQAREAAAFEPEPAARATDGEEPARDTAAFGEASPFVPDVAPAEAGVPELAESAPDADAAEQSTAPAASDEGVVGAYQVGEAHFTIYADGSIQARTPDGDYSFTSMDELKIYLASEKSRLGV